MSRPLRVLLWAPLPPPPGGIAQWAQRYLGGAQAAGLEVTVVNNAPPNDGFSEKSGLRWGRARKALTDLVDFERALRNHRPDVAHLASSLFWGTPREALALALCKLHRVPAVLHLHGSNQTISWREGLGPVRRQALDAVLRSAGHVLVLSEELRVYLANALPGLPLSRVGNMVDVSAVPSVNDAVDVPVLPPRHCPRVLFVGQRIPMKGLGDLAAAIRGLPGVELVVVGGDGEAIDEGLRREMLEHLTALRAEGRLVEVGHLPPDVCNRTYREADVFCLPSYREGMPNVLLEAMAAGVPCVVTPVGGIPEVVGADRGVLVPVGDVPALMAALQGLLANKGERRMMGERARLAVQQAFGVANILARFRGVYEQLLQ